MEVSVAVAIGVGVGVEVSAVLAAVGVVVVSVSSSSDDEHAATSSNIATEATAMRRRLMAIGVRFTGSLPSVVPVRVVVLHENGCPGARLDEPRVPVDRYRAAAVADVILSFSSIALPCRPFVSDSSSPVQSAE